MERAGMALPKLNRIGNPGRSCSGGNGPESDRNPVGAKTIVGREAVHIAIMSHKNMLVVCRIGAGHIMVRIEVSFPRRNRSCWFRR